MIATYRLQLGPQFGFAQARALLPYLQQLGISHVYLSPVTEARLHSTHGYDVVDHNTVRAELGGPLQFQLLLAAAAEHKLRIILDIVPNHAGLGPHNAAWQDVLSYGPHSPFADYFDIEWQPQKPELRGRLLLPFLGEHYGHVLNHGQLSITFTKGRFFASYFDHRFAMTPCSYADILDVVAAHLPARIRDAAQFVSVRTELARMQPVDRPHGETCIAALAACLPDDVMAKALEKALSHLDTAQLHALFERQNWRLANFNTASHEINYRRFFDINDLIGLRMEDPRVFTASHRLVKELLRDEVVAGVRVDHVDGLLDPQAYLERLVTLGARHIWVEKILAPNEHLSPSWPVDGTTGYEFGAAALGFFTCGENKKAIFSLYRHYVHDSATMAQDIYQSKKLVMQSKLAAELQRLAYALDRLSEADVQTRDFTQQTLREALAEVVAHFGRYRTYLPHNPEETAHVIGDAVRAAQRQNLTMDKSVLAFVGKILSAPTAKRAHMALINRFQQYTSPVCAKGLEDTAMYRHTAFIALNEVGASMSHFGLSATQYHEQAQHRARAWPNNLCATATHDSKRGEDTRMRLAALSQMPELWDGVLHDLHALAKTHLGGHEINRHDLMLLFQSLVALWDPNDEALCKRLQEMMRKSVREAKRNSSWTNPNVAYETHVLRLVEALLLDHTLPGIIGLLHEKLAQEGLLSSIGQVILKCTGPGVPDFYQGCEALDLSLVDPDNRRPVDFAWREAQLKALACHIRHPQPAEIVALKDGDPRCFKLYMTARLLHLRQLFGALRTGGYQPLFAQGDCHDRLLAYARDELVVVVTRHHGIVQGQGGFGDTSLPLPENLRNQTLTELLSGSRMNLSHHLKIADMPLPWAVLRA